MTYGRAVSRWPLVVAFVAVACGAGDDDATVFSPEPACARADELVPELLAIAQSAGVPTLQLVVATEVLPDVRSELVRVLLVWVRGLPAGTLEGLLLLGERGVIDALVEPILLLVDAIEGAAKADGGSEALAAVDRMLFECPGQPLFVELAGLLREPTFRADLDALLLAGLDLDAVLLDLGIDVGALSAREGFAALFRSLLALVSSYGSSVDDLLGPGGLLSALVDPDDEVLSTALRLLRQVLAEGPRLEAVRGICRCALATDPGGTLGRFLFDLIQADVLSVFGALSVGGGGALALDDVHLALDGVLLPLLDLLGADGSARRALVFALDALLQPSVAALVLADVRTLLERGVLSEIVALLDALVGGRCAAP